MPVDPLQNFVNARYNSYFAAAKKYGGTVSFFTPERLLDYAYGWEIPDEKTGYEKVDSKCFRWLGGTRTSEGLGIWKDLYLNDFGSGEGTTMGGYQMIDTKNKIVCEIISYQSGSGWGQEKEGEHVCCGYYTISPHRLRDPVTREIIKF
jgi:hypothetical protein